MGFSRNFIHFSKRIFHLLQIVPDSAGVDGTHFSNRPKKANFTPWPSKKTSQTPVFTGFSRSFIHFSKRIFDLLQIVPDPVDTARNRCLRSDKKDPVGR